MPKCRQAIVQAPPRYHPVGAQGSRATFAICCELECRPGVRYHCHRGEQQGCVRAVHTRHCLQTKPNAQPFFLSRTMHSFRPLLAPVQASPVALLALRSMRNDHILMQQQLEPIVNAIGGSGAALACCMDTGAALARPAQSARVGWEQQASLQTYCFFVVRRMMCSQTQSWNMRVCASLFTFLSIYQRRRGTSASALPTSRRWTLFCCGWGSGRDSSLDPPHLGQLQPLQPHWVTCWPACCSYAGSRGAQP